MTPKIGVITGGGDCPGRNAVIRAVAKATIRRGWKAIGILGSYEGPVPTQQTKVLEEVTHVELQPDFPMRRSFVRQRNRDPLTRARTTIRLRQFC